MACKNCKVYPIHDNGGRPFVVYVANDKSNISVFCIPKKEQKNVDWSLEPPESLKYYTELVATYKNPRHIWLGKDSRYPEFLGNSILIQTRASANTSAYVFIGWDIYSFESEQITHYFSLVGNSDVPYPVALSKNNVYFMLDKVYTSRSEFPGLRTGDFADAYTQFFSMGKDINKHKFKKLKVIKKRQL